MTADLSDHRLLAFLGELVAIDSTPGREERVVHRVAEEMKSLGYKDAREIPNYWSYAQTYVLQDQMFQSNASWSFPQHLYLVSEWSARCSVLNDPMSCATNIDAPGNAIGATAGTSGGQLAGRTSRRMPKTPCAHLRCCIVKARKSLGTRPDACRVGT